MSSHFLQRKSARKKALTARLFRKLYLLLQPQPQLQPQRMLLSQQDEQLVTISTQQFILVDSREQRQKSRQKQPLTIINQRLRLYHSQLHHPLDHNRQQQPHTHPIQKRFVTKKQWQSSQYLYHYEVLTDGTSSKYKLLKFVKHKRPPSMPPTTTAIEVALVTAPQSNSSIVGEYEISNNHLPHNFYSLYYRHYYDHNCNGYGNSNYNNNNNNNDNNDDDKNNNYNYYKYADSVKHYYYRSLIIGCGICIGMHSFKTIKKSACSNQVQKSVVLYS